MNLTCRVYDDREGEDFRRRAGAAGIPVSVLILELIELYLSDSNIEYQVNEAVGAHKVRVGKGGLRG